MILHKILAFSWIFMKWHENHGIWCTPAPGLRNSMYYCTILHDLGSSFRWIPIIFMIFHEIHWFPWNHHKIIKGADFAVLVRNSMISPKRACGYLWIRLYIVSPTAPAAKGTTFGHENHKFHHFHEISWKLVEIMIFMEKCEIHVNFIRKQPSAPEAENSSNSYAFLHGSEAVRVLLEPEWWNSLNFTYFSRIPPILVELGELWWFLVFGGWESGFYTKYYENTVHFRSF